MKHIDVDAFHINHITKKFANEDSISYHYNANDAMVIKRNTFNIITGDSGVGKSTLMHILSLIDMVAPPADSDQNQDADGTSKKPVLKFFTNKGEEKNYFDLFYKKRFKGLLPERIFNNIEIARIRKEYFGILPQYGHLIHCLTSKENLELVYRLRNRANDNKSESEDNNYNKLIDDVIKGVDLQDRWKDKHKNLSPAYLSGGQAQRLALARTILCKPDIIFVDEPTSFMDEKLIELTTKLLFGLVKNQNKTVFVVTHKIDDLLKNIFQKSQEVNDELSTDMNIINWFEMKKTKNEGDDKRKKHVDIIKKTDETIAIKVELITERVEHGSAYKETSYLAKSEFNKKRLEKATEDIRAGKYEAHGLIDEIIEND